MKNMKEHLKTQLEVLPLKPGVYKFYDKDGELLYIGKAQSLKKRVSSYFTGSNNENARITLMISKINEIDYTVVDTEYDALLLENSLIKKYQPRYNVNLKDGKTYPYIVIKNERFPRVFHTRNFSNDGSEYYGPYASVSIMYQVLDLIRKLFPTRSCHYDLSEENIQAEKFRVCLDYHINLCKGPCEGLQSEEAYMENIRYIREVLKGNNQYVLKRLKTLLDQASNNFEFEKAQDYKNKIDALQKFQAKSTVVNPGIHNVDVFTIYSKDQKSYINYLKISNGSIIQTHTVEYKKKLNESDQYILLLAIADIRDKFKSGSAEIIVPFDPGMELEGIKVHVPIKGDKKKLLDLSRKNAFYFYQDRMEQESKQLPKTEKVKNFLEKVRKDIDLPQKPDHIEGFDNSNIQGTNPVAAMVCFKAGKPSKKDYRHYNIKTVEGPDDYASMEEVVYRRYKRLMDEEKPLPQLLVIDGGKGQLNAAFKSLKQLGLENEIPVIGIAKRLEEIYKPGDPYPLAIDKKSETLKLIQHIRDEAHRFGLKHHRGKRVKQSLSNELEKIQGIGPQTAKSLLSNFKSVKKVKEAPQEDLANMVGKDKAQKIKAHFGSNYKVQ